MMTCRELTEFLEHYLAGELPAPVLRVFDHHLTLCVNCVRYVSQYRDTIAAGRSAFADLDVPVPDDVPDDLVAAILAARLRSGNPEPKTASKRVEDFADETRDSTGDVLRHGHRPHRADAG